MENQMKTPCIANSAIPEQKTVGMHTRTIKLIDGEFPHARAKNLLLDLVQHKINFHKVEKFSNEFRFGEDREHSEKRIHELMDEKYGLMAWIELMEKAEGFRIHCTIEIETID
jgi:hypothetical protein